MANIQTVTRAFIHRPDFIDVSRLGLFDQDVVKSDRIIGEVENLQISDGKVDMWGSDLVRQQYTFLTAETELFLSSSDNSDTGNVFIEYLDDGYNELTTTIGLTGQTQVSAGVTFFRVNNMRMLGSINTGDIYLAETDTLTAGKPNDLSKIKRTIKANEALSHDGIFTVPIGKKLITNDFYTSVNKKVANQDIKISQIITDENGVRYNVGPFYVSTGSNTTISGLKVRSVSEKNTQMFEITSQENNVDSSFGLAYTLFHTADLIEKFNL